VSDSIQFTLPANTNIGATAFANSSARQEVVVLIDDKPAVTFSGSGTANNLLGSRVFNSGSGRATVRISANGKLSPVVGAQIVLQNKLNFATVGSEDYTDGDYNDGLLVMNWPLG
jgi:hypothetical protein